MFNVTTYQTIIRIYRAVKYEMGLFRLTVYFVFLLLFLVPVASDAQVNSFEELELQISRPTLSYHDISASADSLFMVWHKNNPLDSGFAPVEKRFRRWKLLSQSRALIVNQNNPSAGALKSKMSSDLGLVNFCPNGPADNEWSLIGPNPKPGDIQAHGIVNAIALDPFDENVIYAGAEFSGLFKTLNGGQTWTNVTDVLEFTGLGVEAIAIDPLNSDTLLIGTSSLSFGYPGWLDYSNQGYGILRSEDGGATWTQSQFPVHNIDNPQICSRINVIRFNPQNPNTVFAAGACGIYKSVDNGQTWQIVYDNSNDPILNKIHFIDLEIGINDTSKICASSIKTGGINEIDSAARVFCSNNAGISFYDATPPGVVNYQAITPDSILWFRNAYSIALDVSPADPSGIYAFYASRSTFPDTQAVALYKTNDAGQSWTTVYNSTDSSEKILTTSRKGNWGRYRYQFSLSESSVNKVYVGGDILLVRNFSQANSSWEEATFYSPLNNPGHHADIRDIVMYGSGPHWDKVYIANDGGISKSINSHVTWQDINGDGLAISQINGFVSWPNSERLFMGAMHNGFHFYNYQHRTLGDAVRKLFVDGGFVLAEPGNDSIVYVNSNGGINRCHLNAGGKKFRRIDWVLAGNTNLRSRFDAIQDDSTYIYYPDWELINDTMYACISRFTAESKNEITEFSPRIKDHLSVLKIAPSDPNTIYAAVFEPCWGCADNGGIVRNKFFKKKNGIWTDISSNLRASQDSSIQYLGRCYIEDLLIDPTNPDRLWVGMAYYDYDDSTLEARNRVFYSEDGGLSFTDKSKGLPPYPVNCLAYQVGSDDIIYLGSDAGVYYWDKNANNMDGEWKCFNNGFAPAIVTKIDVHSCRGLVIASTYGRSLWQAPMLPNNGETHITQSESWVAGSERYFMKSLVIDPGVTLNIMGTVKFAPGTSLIIKPGARVNLNGGHLTAYSECGIGPLNWEGVQVLGQNFNQDINTHGSFFISNNGKISLARTAVSNIAWGQQGFQWGTEGGIISGAGAQFLNNRRDLQFVSFHNYGYSPGTGVFERDYMASFTNCTFKRDNQYNMDVPYAAATLWDVNGISFIGCDFINEVDSFPNSGYGIYALTAQFDVDKRINPISGSDDSTRIKGYNYAIYASNVCRADRFTSIQFASLENNKHGIYLNTHANPFVVHNRISIPDIAVSASEPALYGVYFDASTGYDFAQNIITSPNNSYPKVGAVFHNSGGAANLAYKNQFDNMSYGTEAIGNNKGNNSQGGLQFRCNDYGSQNINTKDLTVWTETGVSIDQGIAENQGSFFNANPDPKDLANNLFSRNQEDVFNEIGAFRFNYFHGTRTDQRFNPMNPFNISKFGQNFAVVYNSACPDEFVSTGPTIDLGGLLNDLSLNDLALSGKRSLYTQLINGGNTAELEAQILLAGQSEYQELYIDLISISPYVDQGQLIDLIHNSGFPELALRNVLVANPHSGREPEVMEALIERLPAVSQQTITDVENGSQTITSKDLLEAEMAQLNSVINRQVRKIQSIYIADSTYWDTDSLRNFVGSRKEAQYVFALADFYAARGDYGGLQTLLNQADQTWWSELEMVSLMELQTFYGLIQSNIEDSANYVQLGTAQIGVLQSFQAGLQSPLVWQRVNSLLEAYDASSNSYQEPVYLSANAKRSFDLSRPIQSAPIFDIYPNPAKTYVEVHWDWFTAGFDEPFTVSIYAMDGKQLLFKEIDNYSKNVVLLSTVNFKPGIYQISINSANGEEIHSERLSILK